MIIKNKNTRFYKIAKNARNRIAPITNSDIEYLNGQVDKLIDGSMLLETDNFTQHRGTSRLWHSIAVSYYSYLICKTFRMHCDVEGLVVGALLHDYYLYDWRDIDNYARSHIQVHPEAAVANAKRAFDLTAKEEDIIRKHMYPFTSEPPACKESALVCLVDKLCAIYEVCSKDSYRSVKRRMNRCKAA